VTTPGVLESDSYGVALRVAQEHLRTLDPSKVAERCGAELVDGGDLHVTLFGQRHVVTLPDASVWCVGDGVPGVQPQPGTCPHCQAEGPPVFPTAPPLHRSIAPIWDAILVLHYLGSDGPLPPRDEPIAFGDLPEGKFYDPAFQGRCRVPLERRFGPAPEKLLAAAKKLGGRAWDRGDVSVVIPAFPRVDVYLVFYRGDIEFPPSATVLFSSDVAAFLSAEDIAVLGGAVVGRLGRALGTGTTAPRT
jgi:hypothetical protein